MLFIEVAYPARMTAYTSVFNKGTPISLLKILRVRRPVYFHTLAFLIFSLNNNWPDVMPPALEGDDAARDVHYGPQQFAHGCVNGQAL